MGKLDNKRLYPFEHNAAMSRYTSFRTGGKAALFCVPRNESDLVNLMRDAAYIDAPIYIMGRGTNLLVSDSGLAGAVVKIKAKLERVEWDNEFLTVPAGVPISVLARESVKRGLSGLEWAAGIPGTVGGAVAMNAGAYGAEIKDVLVSVRYYEAGDIIETQVNSGDMGYRTSVFCAPERVVLSARMKLSKGLGDEYERMEELLGQRKAKQPLEYPSAGSTFKRPVGGFAGKLIEDAGLKGFRVGGAMVSKKHAGFVINYDKATSSDIYSLTQIVIDKVYENSGVTLEREIKLWGNFED